MELINFVNQLLGLMTIIAQIGAVVLLALFVFKNKKNYKNIVKYVTDRSLLWSFVISLTATLGSLFYSEIAHYEPCKLCWIQRIFMYPLVLLFGIALKKKDKNIALYGVVFSSLGLMTALYHYTMQRGLLPNVVCSVVGYSTSCAKEFVMQFGYITIPLMSLTAFTIIFLLSLFSFTNNKAK